MCKCTPRTRSVPTSQSNSQFLGQFLLGGLDLGVYLDRLVRATTKKRSTFLARKSAPPDKILATRMICNVSALASRFNGLAFLSRTFVTSVMH